MTALIILCLTTALVVQTYKRNTLEDKVKSSGVLIYQEHQCKQAVEEYRLCISKGLVDSCLDPKEVCK